MDKPDIKLIILPILLLIYQVLAFIDSIQLLNSLGNLSQSTFFWTFEVIGDEAKIQPSLASGLVWFVGPILWALIFAIVSSHDSLGNAEYLSSIKFQAVIFLSYLEFVSFSFAWIISNTIAKSFIEALLALNLYYILPLLVTWYFISESFSPKLLLPKLEARVLTAFFLAILYFVYIITISIGSIK